MTATARRFTASEITALTPCLAWPDAAVRAAVGEGVTGRQIAAAPRAVIQIDDKCWLLASLLLRGPFSEERIAANQRAVTLLICGWAQDLAVALPTGDLRDAIELVISLSVAWCEGASSIDDVREARDLLWFVVSHANADAADAAHAAADAAADAADAAAWVVTDRNVRYCFEALAVEAASAAARGAESKLLLLHQLAEILDGGPAQPAQLNGKIP